MPALFTHTPLRRSLKYLQMFFIADLSSHLSEQSNSGMHPRAHMEHSQAPPDLPPNVLSLVP